MVMRDIGSFHCPRGAAEGNKPELGVMDTACIPK